MNNLTILVDDDPVINFLNRKTLTSNGFEDSLMEFPNGKVALDFLNSKIDSRSKALVLLDITMPVMDGWEFLEALQNKAFENRIHIIMLSSSIDKSDFEKSQEYKQVIDYMEKPLNTEKCKRIMEIHKTL